VWEKGDKAVFEFVKSQAKTQDQLIRLYEMRIKLLEIELEQRDKLIEHIERILNKEGK